MNRHEETVSGGGEGRHQMYQLVAKTGERTPPERAEFVRLFAEVFERAYLSKIQLADAERFAYLGDTVIPVTRRYANMERQQGRRAPLGRTLSL